MIRFYHLILFFFLCQFGFSQSSIIKKFNKDVFATVEMDSPVKAVEQINEILTKAKDRADFKLQGKCYAKLAEVYENINELELALERRNKASMLFRKSEAIDLLLQENYNIGKLHLKMSEPEEAINLFKDCLAARSNQYLDLLCKEGIADAELMLGDTTQSLRAYQEIDSINNASNNISNSNIRINAKQSNILSSQNRIDLANETFNKAALNFSPDITEEEVELFDQAKEQLIRVDPENEIAFRQQSVSQSGLGKAGIPLALNESIELSKKLVEVGRLNEAEKVLSETIFAASNSKSSDEVKEIYKASSELNVIKGDYQKALADLERYEALYKKEAEQQEIERGELIEILKGQLKIDVAEKDNIISFNERELFESRTENKNTLIFFLSLLLIGAIVSSFFIYKNIVARRKANELLLLKSLRSQVNPHFIYNALNSVNNFVAKNDERATNKYISDFSKLMRSILDHSQKDFISLEEELDSIRLYLKLEHARFEDKFEYEINIDQSIDLSAYMLPPMLLQPFIENAVWHGIRYLERDGFISVKVIPQDEQIKISIADNGIGRTKSKALKTMNQVRYKSTGIENVQGRLELINKLYAKDYAIQIDDLHPKQENTGTKVNVILS